MGNDGTLNFDTKIDPSGLQNGLSKIGSIAAGGLKATVGILAGATTAVVGLGAAAVKVGSEFEAEMSKVEAISGATGDQLVALTDKAKEMGSTTKFTATESAQAFEYMAMAGWDTEEMLDGISGIMSLAAASGEDLATTSDIVTDSLTAFGMSASDTTRYVDILAATATSSNTTVSGLGESFKYVAPLCGTLGYSAEDCAVALGLMANAGIKSSQAGTSLRMALANMAAPTKQMQVAMDELGIALTDESGEMLSMMDVMGNMRTAFADLTEAEQTEYASTIFGKQAMSGMLAIINASDQDFNDLTEAIYGSAGAAEEMAAIMQDNLSGQLTILQSGLEGLGLSIYEGIQEPLKDTVVIAQGWVSQLNDAFKADGLTGMVSEFGNVLNDMVTMIVEKAPEFINIGVSLVQNFCDGLRSNTEIPTAAANLIATLATALFDSADQIWLTAIVLAGRIAQGIAESGPDIVNSMMVCITDLVECLVDYIPDFIDAGISIITSLAQGIVENIPFLLSSAILAITDLIAGVATLLPDFVSLAIQFITEVAIALVENLPILVDAVLGLVDSIIETLIQSMPQLLDGAIQLFMAIIDALPIIIEQLLGALPDIITNICDFFASSIPMIIDATILMLMGIIESFPTIIQAIVDNLPQIIAALVDGLIGATPQLIDASITLMMALVDAVPEIVVELAKAVPQIIEGIVNGLANGAGALWDAAKGLGSSIIGGFKDMLGIHSPSTIMEEQGDYLTEGLLNGLADLPDRALEAMNRVLDGISEWGIQLAAKGIDIITTFVTDIITELSELPGKIWTWLTNVVTKVVAWGADLKSKASTAAMNMVNSVIEWISQLPGKIWTWLTNVINKVIVWASDLKQKGAEAASSLVKAVLDGVKDLPDKMMEVGKNIVNGVWNGIVAMKDEFVKNVKDFFKGIVDGVKDILGIKSPSRVFKKEIGVFLMPGVIEGVDETMPDAIAAMEKDAKKLVQKTYAALVLDSIAVGTPAVASANAEAAKTTIVINNYDNSFHQKNEYHVPVPTPSSVSKTQREAARNLFGGVK